MVRIKRSATGNEERDIAQGMLEGTVRWWKGDTDHLHERVFQSARLMARAPHGGRNRIATLNRHAALYSNMNTAQPFEIKAAQDHPGLRNRIVFNLVKSCVDTAFNMMTKNEPFPSWRTTGGDYELQDRAKKLDKALRGIFYECQTYTHGAEAFKDAEIYGTGAVWVGLDPVSGRIKHERIRPAELWVDEYEAHDGHPRQLHRRRLIDRDQLIHLYPDKEREIRESAVASGHDLNAFPAVLLRVQGWQLTVDLVEVIESWHLPSCPGAPDGRHTVCVERATLLDETWDRDRFPIAWVRWTTQPQSFWGIGLGRELDPLQAELSWMQQRIQHILFDTATTKLFIPDECQLQPATVSNQAAGHLYFKGPRPPVVMNPGHVPPDLWKGIDQILEQAYKLSGISEMDAQNEKPGSITSGEGLKAWSDITANRFVASGRAYANLYVDIAQMTIDEMRRLWAMRRAGQEGEGGEPHPPGDSFEISPSGDDYEVRTHGDRWMGLVRWSEIDLERDEYELRMHVISSIPQSTSAKLDLVADFQKLGYIDRANAMRLLDMPDTEAFTELETAPLDSVMKGISDIVHHGRMRQPEKFDPLQLIVDKGTKAYLMYRDQAVPEERLAMLRDWIDLAEAKGRAIAQQNNMQAAQAQTMAGQAPTGASPGSPGGSPGPSGPPANGIPPAPTQ